MSIEIKAFKNFDINNIFKEVINSKELDLATDYISIIDLDNTQSLKDNPQLDKFDKIIINTNILNCAYTSNNKQCIYKLENVKYNQKSYTKPADTYKAIIANDLNQNLNQKRSFKI